MSDAYQCDDCAKLFLVTADDAPSHELYRDSERFPEFDDLDLCGACLAGRLEAVAEGYREKAKQDSKQEGERK